MNDLTKYIMEKRALTIPEISMGIALTGVAVNDGYKALRGENKKSKWSEDQNKEAYRRGNYSKKMHGYASKGDISGILREKYLDKNGR